jgi:hypothetical protein
MAAVRPAFCRLNLAMWRSKLLFAIFIALPGLGWCEVVAFTVDPANIGTLYETGSVDVSSSGLNGTVLAGQSLSLDLVLSNDVLARLLLSDPGLFGVTLSIDTNAGTFPGFAGTTTGSLLDPNGNEIGSAQVAGRGASSGGSFLMGLASFTSANLAGEHALDISGVHFDTSFPDTGYTVTGAKLGFTNEGFGGLGGDGDSIQFGTAQQLPEPSIFWELAVSVLVIAVMKANGCQARVFRSGTVEKK